MTTIFNAYSTKKRKSFKTTGLSKTQQNFKAECDINNILKKYRKTGLLEHVNQYAGKYEDLSNPTDYQTALNIVIDAQASFDSLPSDIRRKFDNNPGKFLEFANNPDNITAMEDLGLIKRPESVPASPAPVSDATPPKVDPAG